ncbi:16S rRNA (cytosine1402-N4)-methyltransferase [Apostasia shenzhenica]|uniref:16S rRNA (Cytosine1402-N4)-methyltransferase n=1 Tax=Apostasia shenzhenica TaxID=1088818 RepID=A0A2I0BDF5_9ASPA|nr:16S rRNA (cytosine1402-N4)-methyltransferase [Apostasia shenzhenica]
MAVTGLFFLRTAYLRRHQSYFPFSFLSLHTTGGLQSQRSVPAPPAVAGRGVTLKADRRKRASAANRASSPEHLKRRTRSGVEFDCDLYRRYAAGGHVPVMFCEVLEAFRLPQLRSFVDCTLGAAGHSFTIIEAHRELELFVGLDVDPVAHEKARARIEALLGDGSREQMKAYIHLRNFKHIKSVLVGIDENLLNVGVDGILMDLGISSMQVDHFERGFSVLGDGPLDMRMDPQATLKAEDILNSWPEAEVGRIMREYGEESNWQLLLEKIVAARKKGGLHSTGEFLDLVRKSSAKCGGRQGWIKTATRVFQALRIAVNDELQTLENALYACFDCLSSGGRLAVISFHSLEDRIVKKTFLEMIKEEQEEEEEDCGKDIMCLMNDQSLNETQIWSKQKIIIGRNGTILTKRPITPSEQEEKLNRRCRSAKLRIIQKH